MGKKYTYEEVKEYVELQGYKLLSEEYINNKTKLKMICPKGHKFEVRFDMFKHGQRCPICAGTKKITYEEAKSYIESFDYRLISNEYINNKTKLKMKCPKDHEFEMRFDHFKRGIRCPICGGTHRLDYNYVKSYIERFNYKLLSKEYKNNRSLLDVRCPKGHEFKVKFNNFQFGSRCPKCAYSKGETELKRVLKELKIEYKHQHCFKNCKIKRCLPFDFYLPKYNCCVEFDGRQHFEVVGAFGGLNGFIDTKIRDTIKTEFCKKNDINLIRIPYWDIDNIKNILLDKIINKQGKTPTTILER